MDQNKTAKYKFTDDYGDTIDVYQRGNQIFIDGTFEYGRTPDFRGILSADSARRMANVLNKLAAKIEEMQ